MPTLEELKTKWFIDVADGSTFPPRTRHAGTTVRKWTDNNRVTALRDGARFMGKWADALDAMRTGSAPSECEVWLTGWRLEGVETRGHDKPESNALDMLKAADELGVGVYGMISRHIPGLTFNYPTLAWLNANNMWGICVDNRFPTRGSGHQKFSCLRDPQHRHCLVGSIDISKTRWDTESHDFKSDQRNPRFGKPTHDTGVLVEGPAVSDIEATFQERWDDPTRTLGLLSTMSVPPPLPVLGATTAVEPIAGATHSVQVLHTYGRAARWEAYSWSPSGEFTAWACYLNAIQKASTYIYIEDQYFLPFGYEPLFAGAPAKIQDSDLIYQLGRAIVRGVKVLAIVPSNAEDKTHAYQKYQRDIGIEHLKGVAAGPGVKGEFVVASLTNGVSDVYVHSKLMIVDDELVLIGSANVGRRSMTFDSELQLAIVDGEGDFAAGFRTELWAEHLSTTRDLVEDAGVGYALMKKAGGVPAPGRTGHVKAYPYQKPGSPSLGHKSLINLVIEPYGGPP